MHLIGFSHHYTKLCGQTYGTLLSVNSTKSIRHRPDKLGIDYDTEFVNMSSGMPAQVLNMFSEADFDKPLLQLVFIGAEHQIPFTTYREFPKDYKPFYPIRMKWIPYSDLIGEEFAFKFKGEKLPESLANRIYTPAVKIFN